MTQLFKAQRHSLELERSRDSARTLANLLTATGKRLEQIVTHSPTGILLTNSEGLIQLANPFAEELFGWPPNSLIGQSIDVLVPEAARHRHADQRRHFLETSNARIMGAGRDLDGVRQDGSLIPVEVGLSPYHDEKGHTVVLVMVTDISRRLEAQRETRRTLSELERSNEELSQFARMTSLLNALLQYSKVGRKEDKPTAFEVRHLLDDVIGLQDKPKAFTIRTDASAFPSLNAPRGALLRVFGNLIGNTLKHHNREDGEIVIGCADKGDFFEFTVTDDGPGIAPEFHKRIFDMFQTLLPRDQQEGSGMGLALVKKTIEHHGGSIRVDSVPGKGSTFAFTWPKSTAMPDQPDAQPLARPNQNPLAPITHSIGH